MSPLNPYQFGRINLVENKATLKRSADLQAVRGGYQGDDIDMRHTDEYQIPDHHLLPSGLSDLISRLSNGRLPVHPRDKARLN